MGSGLVINGKAVPVEGLDITNFLDDPKHRRSSEDGAFRKAPIWVKQIILHTTRGQPGGSVKTPQYVIPGGKDLKRDERTTGYWKQDPKQSSAHLTIDADGSAVCIADLATEVCYHAGQREVNEHSIGIEISQEADSGIYEASLLAAVKIVNFLTSYFGIQRQVHLPYRNGPIIRLSSGGDDVVGIFGHRDASNNRGLGDPGDIIFSMLIQEGYEAFDFSIGQDLDVWRERQKILNSLITE